MANNLHNDLVVTPLGELIASIGKGVGEAQAALDAGSLKLTMELYRNLKQGEKEDPACKALKEIGYRPTFYVLPETTVTTKITLNMKGEDVQDIPSSPITPIKALPLKSLLTKRLTYATPVNAANANKYNIDLQSTTELTFKIVPVPAPVFVDNLIETGEIENFIKENKELLE